MKPNTLTKAIVALAILLLPTLVHSQCSPKISSATNPQQFTLVTNSFNGIVIGFYSKPTVTDIDHDGLLDLVVGKNDGTLSHYEQASANSTTFSLVTASFNGIDEGWLYAAPTFTDLDGDGLLDLLVGDLGGEISHYEQASANSQTFMLVTNSFNGIDVGLYSTPSFTDLDGDGLLDLIIGNSNGTYAHFEQSATNSLVFASVTNTFLGVDIGFDSSPAFTDFDGDGLLDFISGEFSGNIFYYKQNAANSTAFTGIDPNFSQIDVGRYSAPTFTDLDNDGMSDLLIGKDAGTIVHYEQDRGSFTNFGTTTVGTATTTQTVKVWSSCVAGTITVTAPTGFEVSLSPGSGFGSSVTLTPTSGKVVNTTVYVRFNPSSAGTFSGNLALSSTNATTVNYVLSGIACQPQISSATNPQQFTLVSNTFNGIDVGFYSTPTVTDIDHDGLLDLVVGRNAGILNHYEQASANSQTFTFITATLSGINVGSDCAPTFTDLDGDGLLDLLVGEGDGNIDHYEQANVNSQTFTLVTTSFNSISAVFYATPSFTDLDGDGLLDLIIGRNFGTYSHYEQSAVNSVVFTSVTSEFLGVDIGSTSTPTFTDFDGDGLLDFVSGVRTGNILYFKQNAINSTAFTSIDPNFNQIDVGDYSAPIFTDLDNDGMSDLLIGKEAGTIVHYEQDRGSFTDFGKTTVGTASTTQSVKVWSSCVAGTITVTAPTGFEVSLSQNSGFGSSVTLTPTSGKVVNTTVYVRFNPSSGGTFSGNLALASAGATTVNYALNGTGQEIVIGLETNPTTCGGTDGSLAFTSRGIAAGSQTLSYKKDAAAVATTTTVTVANDGSFTLTGLGKGVYSDFTIGTVTASGNKSLSDPPTPTLVAGTPTNPTTCGGTGNIPFTTTNLGNGAYTLNYKKGTTAQTASINIAANAFTLNGLAQGTYSEFSITNAGCTGSDNNPKTLTDPPTPTLLAGTAVNPTTCGGTGNIPFTTTNLGNGAYTLNYKKGTTAQTASINIAANAFTLNGLAQGTYSEFSITNAGCTGSDNNPKTLTDPPTPTLVAGTAVNPTTCGGTGNIPFTTTNLGNGAYMLNYKKGTTAQTASINIVANAFTLNGLAQGTYSEFSITNAGCTGSDNNPKTLTDPPTPTLLAGTVVNPNTCGGTGNIPFTTTNLGNGAYTLNYKKGTTAQTASINIVANAFTLNGLAQGTYSEFSITNAGCTGSDNNPKTLTDPSAPTITLTTQQQTFPENTTQILCDNDTEAVNGLQFTTPSACLTGSLVWRTQVNGTWSAWSNQAPSSQPSDNQSYRYQAACDANCASTFSGIIELTINYRASTPQNVSLTADGVRVNAGETKTICNVEGTTLLFQANCGTQEVLLYAVDGGIYSTLIPTQLVDNQFHNYRVRCQKANGTPSCVETESEVMRLRIVAIPSTPTVSLSVESNCGTPVSFSGISSCGSFATLWYDAATNVVLPNLPSQTPNVSTSYYARCQSETGCLSGKSNTVTFTLTPVTVAPVVTASQEIVCAGTTVRVSANCPVGSTTFWNTGVNTSSFEVAFTNATKQTYWAKCIFENGCQSMESVRKDIYWNAFVVTMINVGQSKSAVKPANDKALWSSQFITKDGGPELEQSTRVNPTLYYVENPNKVGPRYWTINVDACGLGTNGSLTFDLLATPETGVPQSFNTHENNAPYFMYANREGWTELYAQNHPAYGFYQDNGVGGNVYDIGLPKGLHKLSIRYWDQKGWGSIYPSIRKPQGNVLAYQEYWFRIQSKDGVGVGAARVADSGQQSAVSDEQIAIVPPLGRYAARARGLFVLPNPVTNILRLQVSDRKGQVIQTELTDASGRSVLRRQFIPETNTHQEEFGVGELPNGMYFLKVTTDNQKSILKVVKVD